MLLEARVAEQVGRARRLDGQSADQCRENGENSFNTIHFGEAWWGRCEWNSILRTAYPCGEGFLSMRVMDSQAREFLSLFISYAADNQ